jgi:hypothetical protein
MIPRRTGALLLTLLAACSGNQRFVRLDTGEGETIVHTPRTSEVEPVKLEGEEFRESLKLLALQVRLTASPRETVWKMFELDVLSGEYLYLPRDRKLVPMGSGTPLEGALTEEEEKLTSAYKSWCQRAYHMDGDCLGGALVGDRYLDLQGRYVLALALSKSPVLDEMKNALGEMVTAQAVMSTALWTVSTLLVLLALPEPVTKILAAGMATTLILWVGVDTLYNLVTGWFQLMQEAREATTFEELREAGERYGKVMGRDAARAFALLAMAAIGQTASGFTAKVPTLPGSAQAAMQADAQGGIWLPVVGEVTEVAVTGEGFRVALAPGALAMTTRGGRGDQIEAHHIGTRANDISTLRGGPWTPRFRELFAKAGMKLEDAENIVSIQGHKGPHPERYHRLVHERLDRATRTCRSMAECRVRLTRALEKLAEEIATPGTELNQLVTRAEPR